MTQVFKNHSQYFRVEIEIGEDDFPSQIRLECTPMPIYFAFKVHDFLPHGQHSKRELQGMITDFLRLLEKDLRDAIPSEFK